MLVTCFGNGEKDIDHIHTCKPIGPGLPCVPVSPLDPCGPSGPRTPVGPGWPYWAKNK